ncbi:CitMHS family transporter [Halobacillus shinanisalinarum]|uniref:CitMHS family transporter n=1 Tax=Halobacillus shinanisalinarum TaxID=2932258 RepID=A0ABY4GW22_9BACI|nr:CitMHS family transporter [Halobacillus shinanisalinarum]UOQ92366.1 CitMHS family transporter [Halobacillus shinanisalinarum]
MLSLIGFLTILAIVLLLISGRISPIVGLVLVPIIGAIIAGFSVGELGTFFEEGIGSVMEVVIMFVFAILFFGVMQDAGLFDPMIKKMVAVSGGNVISVAVGTVIVAAIAHLDGSGASTFLITLPALLPLYKRLNMSPYLLLLLVGTSASIMNMAPWGGPIGRTASVLNMDPTDLWRPLIPLQIVGMVLLMGMAVILAIREKKRIARFQLVASSSEVAAATEAPPVIDGGQNNTNSKNSSLLRPNLIWLNLGLTLGVIGVLVWGVIPAGFVFMIGLSIALPLNYPQVNDQMNRIKAHAPSALLMAAIIMAAGSFLGILNGTGMLEAMSEDLVKIIPSFVLPYLHLIIGLLGVPFSLLLSTDAFYFALFPIIEQITTDFGITSITTAHTMIIGNIIGTFISPFAPALWLALGLTGLEMGRHIRYSLFWMWGFSVVLLMAAFLMGIVPFS